MAVIGVGTWILFIAFYAFFGFCLATLASKLGRPFGTSLVMALIPIANIILLLQLAGKPWWWIFLLMIPILNIIFFIIVWMRIAEARGRPGWWGIAICLVPIMNIILFLILVFGGEKASQVSA